MSKVLLTEDINVTAKFSMLFKKPPKALGNLLMTIAVNGVNNHTNVTSGLYKDALNLFNSDKWNNEFETPIKYFPPSLVSVNGPELEINFSETIFDDGDVEKITDIQIIPDLMGDLDLDRNSGAFSCVYIIRNMDTDVLYIGSSYNCYKRLREHRNDLRNKRHCNIPLQYAFNKLKSELQVYVIKTTEVNTPFWLENVALTYINKHGETYNIGDTAELPRLGVPVSEETRRKQSEAHMGSNLSFESRSKMSSIRKGRKYTPDHVENAILKLKKSLMGDGVKYESAAECARITGIGQSSITRRLTNPNYPGWYMIGSIHDPDVKSGKVEQTTEKNAENFIYLIEGSMFFTSEEAGRMLGYSSSTVKRRVRDDRFPDWEKVPCDDPIRLVKASSKAIVVNGVHYPSLRIAADALGLHYSTISDKLSHPVNHPNSYYVGSFKDPNYKE